MGLRYEGKEWLTLLPALSLRVKPSVTEMLKWGWIQYLAVLVIVYYITQWLKRILFRTGVLHTFVYSDGPTKVA